MKTKNRAFWITELILMALAAFFAFALIGYGTLALMLIAVAAVVALYRLIGIVCRERPGMEKRLNFALSFILVLCLLAFAALEGPIIGNAKTDRDVSADYAIVLGAGVNGTEPSLSLLNRLEAALEYAEANPQARIIVSGGKGPGESITEAECMRLWLEDRGVEPQRIIKEEKASSTAENLLFSQRLIAGEGSDPTGKVAVITAEYHLCRAKLMAANLGMRPLGVAARTSYPVLMVNYFIREAFALAAYIML